MEGGGPPAAPAGAAVVSQVFACKRVWSVSDSVGSGNVLQWSSVFISDSNAVSTVGSVGRRSKRFAWRLRLWGRTLLRC